MKHVSLHLAAFVLAASFAADAHASIFTVGSGTGCTHGTIQAAINAAASHPGYDVIRLTRSLTYQSESNTVNTSDDLSIVGGFATCTQSPGDGVYTTVSGLGASGNAVFKITANGSAIVKLRQLDIKYGSAYGIQFSGNGILQTIETTIERNGKSGIFASATGSDAELVIDTGTLIISNGSPDLFPGASGGGISLHGPIEMTMIAPQSMISLNSATYGGGLYVDSGAYAYIGSPGYGGLPAINTNSAHHGGGAYVNGNGVLKLFATAADKPVGVRNNDADNGGGVYAGNGGHVCAWDFTIDGNSAAESGAALYGDNGTIVLNRDDNARCTPHPAAVRCASGRACNSISGNLVQGDNGGSVELGSSLFDSQRLRMQDNEAAFAIHGLDSDVRLNACLLAGNTVSKRLLDTYGANAMNSLFVDSCTLAGNAIGEMVLYATRKSWLTDSIIDQPSNIVADFSSTPGMSHAANLLVTSVGGLPAMPSIVLGDPMFVDAAHGDYHLTRHSPAVDFAPAGGFSSLDLDRNPRDVDQPDVPNRFGPRDVGAYESAPLADLIFADGFQ